MINLQTIKLEYKIIRFYHSNVIFFTLFQTKFLIDYTEMVTNFKRDKLINLLIFEIYFSKKIQWILN